jgi:hypothetical protein
MVRAIPLEPPVKAMADPMMTMKRRLVARILVNTASPSFRLFL